MLLAPTKLFIVKKFFFEGLGFRIFLFRKSLFLFFGMSHCYKLVIPPTLIVSRVKGRLFISGFNTETFHRF